MRLTAIRAKRFRNLQEVDLSLPQGLTLVMGANGHGKTSLLEAAYVLATGRSFRTRKADDLVAWDGGPLNVTGRVCGRRGERADTCTPRERMEPVKYHRNKDLTP